jgi:hypothetical protein
MTTHDPAGRAASARPGAVPRRTCPVSPSDHTSRFLIEDAPLEVAADLDTLLG